ncbi:hypothetical protein SDJN02_14197, partial [Cucurbita argyrosperma subsp. argyrosperma]
MTVDSELDRIGKFPIEDDPGRIEMKLRISEFVKPRATTRERAGGRGSGQSMFNSMELESETSRASSTRLTLSLAFGISRVIVGRSIMFELWRTNNITC